MGLKLENYKKEKMTKKLMKIYQHSFGTCKDVE